jgi:predicted nuclease of predicted toxin-antitoxin system
MRFLIDEMFPFSTCSRLVERGHDAIHVRDLGLNARPDREIAAAAGREDRVLVTENVKDFAAEHDIMVVCVPKSHLAQHGMNAHLASLLDQWASAHPDPYVGLHWPKVER